MKISVSAATWISLLSLVVASASFFVSFRTQQLTLADELSVQASIPGSTFPIQLSNFEIGHLGVVVTAPFEFTLTNTGNRKLSVTRYELYALNSWGEKSWYSNIDGGLMDAKGDPLHLPLTLDIGESTRGFVRVGMLANNAAIRTLEQTKKAVSISRKDLDFKLAKNGIDLFGNKVTLNEFPAGGYTIEGPGPKRKTPSIIVTFQTGKGATASTLLSWYP